MARELVDEEVAKRFVDITENVSGRARNSALFIEEGSFGATVGNGPWTLDSFSVPIHGKQATIVRDEASGYTTANDVTIQGDMIDLSVRANYHMQGLPSDAIDMIAGRDTGVPAPFSMLIQHELGHVTVHPAGDLEGYKRQGESMPLPQTGGFTSRIMNLLSDLVLNHSVMHSANILGSPDPDDEMIMRRKAIIGLAGLYMLPQCVNYQKHAQMVEDGTLPDTRYTPTEPCTATSDPNSGPPVQCSVAAAGGIHPIGCYDDHFVNPNEPDDADNFMRAGFDSKLWQALTGHGRGKQIYPMLSTAVLYDLPESNRTVLLPGSLSEILGDSPLRVHNCNVCQNVWYAHDTAYTDLSMGSFNTNSGEAPDADFREMLERYAQGDSCPGRVPWESSCSADASQITTFDITVDHRFLVSETWTYDNRSSADTAIYGMEPIWLLGLTSTSTGITHVRGPMNPMVRVDRSYFVQLCPQCEEPTQNYYGVGYMHRPSGYLTEMLERIPQSHQGSEDMKSLNQLLMIMQWSGIYSGMAPVIDEPLLRITNPSGNRLALGNRSAKEWLKLAGITAARINRGC